MTQTPQEKTKPTATGDRMPIRLDRFIITHANAYGATLPHGNDGKGEKMLTRLIAGEEGPIKTELELLPWMRAIRVKRSLRVTHTAVVQGKETEVVSWKPAGKPFFIPETWGVWVPADEQ